MDRLEKQILFPGSPVLNWKSILEFTKSVRSLAFLVLPARLLYVASSLDIRQGYHTADAADVGAGGGATKSHASANR